MLSSSLLVRFVCFKGNKKKTMYYTIYTTKQHGSTLVQEVYY